MKICGKKLSNRPKKKAEESKVGLREIRRNTTNLPANRKPMASYRRMR